MEVVVWPVEVEAALDGAFDRHEMRHAARRRAARVRASDAEALRVVDDQPGLLLLEVPHQHLQRRLLPSPLSRRQHQRVRDRNEQNCACR